MSENTTNTESEEETALPKIPACPAGGTPEEDAQVSDWLGDRVNDALSHCQSVSEAGIPIALLCLAAIPQDAPKLVDLSAPAPEGINLRISLESPAIALAQTILENESQGVEVDPDARASVQAAVIQTKVALERALAIMDRLMVRLDPSKQDTPPDAAQGDTSGAPAGAEAGEAQG